MSSRLLVISALPLELGALARHLGAPTPGEGRVVPGGCVGCWSLGLACTGIGPARASEATRRALTQWPSGQVLTIGFAGALGPEPAQGDLIRCNEVLWPPDAADALRPLPGPLEIDSDDVRSCRWMTADRVVADPEEKAVAHARTGAQIVDMETGPVIAACNEAGVPCAAVRTVWDAADERIAPDTIGLIDHYGRLRLGVLLRRVLRRPTLLLDLVRMGRTARRLSGRLAQTVLALLEDSSTCPVDTSTSAC